ncbi:MAG: efflux RND transporter periplasmic adaptor subunit, partial [Pseudomonadales bacterium]
MRYLILFLAMFAAGACDSLNSGGAAAGKGPKSGGFSRGPTFVLTQVATLREIRDEVEAIGTTYANESVTVTAKVTDTVSKVNFEDGQTVEKGAVLVELTKREQVALLDEAEANRNDARIQARRLEMLAAEGTIPLSQLDEAHARLSASEARYQSIVARIQDRLIQAPFSGVLGFREVSEGTLVTPGSTITTLDDISIIKLDFSIPEVYLDLVEVGLPDDAIKLVNTVVGLPESASTTDAMTR